MNAIGFLSHLCKVEPMVLLYIAVLDNLSRLSKISNALLSTQETNPSFDNDDILLSYWIQIQNRLFVFSAYTGRSQERRNLINKCSIANVTLSLINVYPQCLTSCYTTEYDILKGI